MVTIRLYLGLLLCVLCIGQTDACDVCGCGVSNSSMGLLSNYRQHFVRVGWHYALFNGKPGSGYGASDHFHIFQMDARYHFSNRWRGMLYQTFSYNLRHGGLGRQRLSGMGDTRLMLGYTLLDKETEKGGKWFAELNAGVQLPTGSYDERLHDRNLPEHFNAGRGNWGALLQGNLVFQQNDFGVLLNVQYQHHTESRGGYHFGDQASTQIMGFWNKPLKGGNRLTLNAGLNPELIRSDKHANGKTVHGTGGAGLYGNFGAQFQHEDYMLAANYALPITDSYSDGEVETKGRVSVQVSFLF